MQVFFCFVLFCARLFQPDRLPKMSQLINDPAYITIEEYVRRSSPDPECRMSVREVRRLVNKGAIPTLARDKAGEKIYINIALEHKQALEGGEL